MSGHAVLSPSSADSWSTCTAAPAMQKGLPDSPSEYSDEGTAAHLLLETCIRQGKEVEEFAGRRIVVGHRVEDEFDGAVWVLAGDEFDQSRCPDGPLDYGLLKVRNQFTVDEEMTEAIGLTHTLIRQYAQGALLLEAEQKVSVEKYTTEPGGRGTMDCCIVVPGELQIHDLKYGKGVEVEAAWNRQLALYAIGKLDTLEDLEFLHGPIKRVRFVIHQPRVKTKPDEWDCSVKELRDFVAKELTPKAQRAWTIYQTGEITEADFAPSADACRWCRAKPHCQAPRRVMADEFGIDTTGEPPEAEAYQLPSRDPANIDRMMKFVPLLEAVGKAVRAECERLFMEEPGRTDMPSWKLVEGKKGNRQWKDEEAVDALLKSMRLTVEDRCNLKLKSPAQIEKVLKESPRKLKKLHAADLVTQTDGKPSVAPADDKRPRWTPPNPADAFTATAE